MSNKTSFINKTVKINSSLTFAQMELLERTLKDAYLEAATGSNCNAMQDYADLGESLGVDAEETIEDSQTELQEVV